MSIREFDCDTPKDSSHERDPVPERIRTGRQIPDAAAALRESEENRIFENAPIGIYQSTMTSLLRANPALTGMFGFGSPAEMVAFAADAKSLFVNPEQRGKMVLKAIESRGYVEEEVGFRRRDGSTFVGRVRLSAVREESGKVRLLEGFVEDVTKRKQMEAGLALREHPFGRNEGSEGPEGILVEINERKKAEQKAMAALNYVQTLLQSCQIGIITYRATGEAVSANPAAVQMVGGTVEQLAAQNFRHLESWKKSGLLAAAEAAIRTGTPQELEVEHFSTFGKSVCLSAKLIPFDYEGKPHLLGLFLDITAFQRSVARLRESEEKFRQLAENIDSVFWICTKDKDRMLYVSPTYEKIRGRSCESLYQNVRSFADAIHPEDRKRVLAALNRGESGEGYNEEYRIVRPDGGVRWIHDRGFVVRNESGKFYRLAGLAEDITERRQLEEQLRQAQKMEAIGQLAGGIAHDFNNILSAILMHLGLLRESSQLTIGMKEGLKEVENEAMRAANLTRQLLLFSRRQMARVEPLDANHLIKDLLKVLGRVLGENIEVAFEPTAAVLWVKADAGMVEQIVMNLCINARDAMPRGGRLTLGTRLVERRAGSVKSYPEARPGLFACLEVRDTGCGMDENVLSRMFEPFFSTKERGTGLGLATVYGIVNQHEGWIEVDSEVEKGSSFRVYLPALSTPVQESAGSDRGDEVLGGSETIMLVEDDGALRRAASLCLRKLGYAVLEAANAREALKVWEQHQAKIKLLITDMVMPEEMTGLELAQRLQEDNDTLRIIISSGYSTELARHDSLKRGLGFLAKPYTPATLATRVRQCLDDRAPA